MASNRSLFAVGNHRPVYLWAGSGTIRMNQLKFMNAPVDQAVHQEAYTPLGASRMAGEAGFNWAYLTYDWGFPPEVEQEDWEAFRQAVQVYHASDVRVFGYIQTSNCVYAGSYRDQDWYALDPWGHPFYYYTGRYMTCWLHPAWLEHLQEMVRGVVEAGAEGVFFDNPWHASQPFHFSGTWMGTAGCYCPRCRTAFRDSTGLAIPTQITPENDETSRRYLCWRAGQVTATLGSLADLARSLNPEIVVSANNFDAVMRPSYLIYGIDLPALARVQDVLMIEDYGLPRWEPATSGTAPQDSTPPEKRDLLVNNALTLRTARALAGGTPVSTDPYDKGIGFDDVYTTRRFQQGLAEAAACGSAMVVKGTEYVANGRFTLLTAERYAPQRQAIDRYHTWLAEHAALYQDRQNLAPIGLLHPGDALWERWDCLAPLYFGVGQTLLAEGIPWRVVTANEDVSGLKIMIHFEEQDPKWAQGPRFVDCTDLPGWQPAARSFLSRHTTLRRPVSGLIGSLYRAYFRARWARQLGDRLGLAHFFSQSIYFRLPAGLARRSLLTALAELPYPRVQVGAPVLTEIWRQGTNNQLHLVNYAPQAQELTIDFDHPVHGQIISPDQPAREFSGAVIHLSVDIYSIFVYDD